VVSVYELEIYLTETATWCLPVLQTHKGPYYFGSHHSPECESHLPLFCFA